MQVRIRHVDDAEATILGDIPLTKEAVESVIPLLSSWSVSSPYGIYDYTEISGQFSVDETGAYFEVLLGSE